MSSLPTPFRSAKLHFLVNYCMLVFCASHFGLEIARSLASAGCDLVITSRTLADAEVTATALAENHNVAVKGLALDVSDFASVEQAFDDAVAAMGHVDILVNNAGGGTGPGANVGGIFDRSNAAVEALIQANLMGSFYCWYVSNLIARRRQ